MFLANTNLTFALTLILAAPTLGQVDPVQVTVDFGQDAPTPKNQSGFTHGIQGHSPPNHLVGPLEVALYRTPLLFDDSTTYDRVTALGARSIWNLNSWAIPYDYYDGTEGEIRRKQPYENFVEYEAFLRAAIASVGEVAPELIYDIWNEPNCMEWPESDCPEGHYFHGTEQQFFDTFKLAHDVIREELGDDVLISGPGYANTFDYDQLQRFVDFARDNALKVQVLAWHELGGRMRPEWDDMTDDLLAVRAAFIDDPAYDAVGIEEIQIQEIISDAEKLRPGANLAMFYHLETGGSDGAARSLWYGEDGEYNSELNHLLTPEAQEPRPVWWANKAYAETLTDRVVSTSDAQRIVHFASKTSYSDEVAQLVIGSYLPEPAETGTQDQVTVTFDNLAALGFLEDLQTVTLTVYRIPYNGEDPFFLDAGEDPLLELEWVEQVFVDLVDGTATHTLEAVNLHEAYVVRITDAGVDPPLDAAPEITVNVASLDHSVYFGELTLETGFMLSNSGGRILDWALDASAGVDIVFTPAAGVLEPFDQIWIDLSIDVEAIPAGEHSELIFITAEEAVNNPFELPLNLTVLANARPVAIDQSLQLNEGSTSTVILDYTDDVVTGDSHTFSIITPPATGSVEEVSPGIYAYTPSEAFFGSDSFEWTVNDGLLESETAVVTLQVNQVPIARDQAVVTVEDEPIAIALDYDDDAMPGPHVFTITVEPNSGTVVEVGGLHYYTPNTGFDGTDSFAWQLDDGLATSRQATVSVTVDDAPEITTAPLSLAVEEYFGTGSTNTGFTLTNTGDRLLEWNAAVANGGNTVLLPDSGALAAGEQIWIDIEIDLAGLPQGVFDKEITVQAVGASNDLYALPLELNLLENQTPEAFGQAWTINQDQPIDGVFEMSDDNLPLAIYDVQVLEQPLFGTLELLAEGAYRYTPNSGFAGEDSFRWSVSDGLLESSPARVTVAINQIPVAHDLDAQTSEGEWIAVTPSYDDEGLPGPYTLTIVTLPAHGQTMVENGLLYYAPDEGFDGSDSFSWTVDDGMATSNEATVSITVDNDPEVATDRTLLVFEGPAGSEGLPTTLTVTNSGGGTMTWEGLDFQGLGATFEPASGTLAAGQSMTVTVTMATVGRVPGTYSGTLGLNAPDASNGRYPLTVEMTITGD